MVTSMGAVAWAAGAALLLGCGDGGAPGGADGGDRAVDARAVPDGAPTTTELAWFSDWRAGTGDAQATLYDAGKWTDQLCDATGLLEVVPATGLDFPTANVLRVAYDEPSRCLMLRAAQRWRQIAVGEYLFLRVYYRNAIPDGSQIGFPHPIHLGEGAPYTVWVNVSGSQGGTAGMTMQLTGAAPWPDRGWAYPFATQQTYRLELRIHRTGETTGKLAVRVHDAAGALLGDETAWHNGEAGPNSRTLAASDPTITLGEDVLGHLDLGNNDPAGLVGGAPRYMYFGAVGVAISSDPDAWPGPYPSATEAE